MFEKNKTSLEMPCKQITSSFMSMFITSWFTYCTQNKFICKTSSINLEKNWIHPFLTCTLPYSFHSKHFANIYDRTRPCYFLSINLYVHFSQRTFCMHCTLLRPLLSSASAQPGSVSTRSFQ